MKTQVFRIFFCLIGLLMLTNCDDDQFSESFPDIDVDPNPITLTAVEVGEESARAVTLRNAGRAQLVVTCLLYTSPSPRDRTRSRMPSSA